MTSCGTGTELAAPQEGISSRAATVQVLLLRLQHQVSMSHGWGDAAARPEQRHQHKVGMYVIPEHWCFQCLSQGGLMALPDFQLPNNSSQ